MEESDESLSVLISEPQTLNESQFEYWLNGKTIDHVVTEIVGQYNNQANISVQFKQLLSHYIVNIFHECIKLPII